MHYFRRWSHFSVYFFAYLLLVKQYTAAKGFNVRESIHAKV
jgi:hypothetical protein